MATGVVGMIAGCQIQRRGGPVTGEFSAVRGRPERDPRVDGLRLQALTGGSFSAR